LHLYGQRQQRPSEEQEQEEAKNEKEVTKASSQHPDGHRDVFFIQD